jgi:hypothetical protein
VHLELIEVPSVRVFDPDPATSYRDLWVKTMPEKRALSCFSCGLVDQIDLVVVPDAPA